MIDTSWVKEGIACAEVSRRIWDNARFTTIERLTATQVVCASGNRYRGENLVRVGGDYQQFLRPADDRQVRDIRARGAIQNLRNQIDELLREVRHDEAGSLVLLDEIERLVAEIRATIANPARND